jgi:hypothetical protein
MIDNVLLEKRNRYLGKLIKKTQHLTESVKILADIDKELNLHSGGQSGGTFYTILDKWTKAQGNKTNLSYSTDLQSLREQINILEKSAEKLDKLHEKLNDIEPVIFHDLGINITELIDKLKTIEGHINKNELIDAIKLFGFGNMPTLAKEYTQLYNKFKMNRNNDTIKKEMVKKRQEIFKYIYDILPRPGLELFKKMINILYSPLPGPSPSLPKPPSYTQTHPRPPPPPPGDMGKDPPQPHPTWAAIAAMGAKPAAKLEAKPAAKPKAKPKATRKLTETSPVSPARSRSLDQFPPTRQFVKPRISKESQNSEDFFLDNDGNTLKSTLGWLGPKPGEPIGDTNPYHPIRQPSQQLLEEEEKEQKEKKEKEQKKTEEEYAKKQVRNARRKQKKLENLKNTNIAAEPPVVPQPVTGENDDAATDQTESNFWSRWSPFKNFEPAHQFLSLYPV